jgi:hypothetical protein
MAGYDAKKAELYNKLVQSGVSQDTAFTQSGISETETGNYALGDNGQLGATVAGAGKVAGVDYDKVTAANAAESNRFNQGLASPSNFEQVDYAEDAKSPPGKVTPINYTTTSTETVSGGGSTSVVAGPRVPTAASQSVQPAINAKQAEIDQFTKDNPSDFARKKQGLPPLSPEEKQQRQEKLDTLTAERGALKNQQIDAESTTPPTTTTVPNTTTTTQTVTTGTSSTNQQVDPINDDKLSQENEAQLSTTTSPANASTARAAAPVEAQTTVDENGQVVSTAPVVVDANNEILDGGLTNQEILAQTPAPVTLSDEEILARQNAGGLSDQEILARTPPPVVNPPYDEFAGVDQAVAINAASPVDTPLTPAQQEAALNEAVTNSTPSAEDVAAADDKSLQDQENIRTEAAASGVSFDNTNNESTAAMKALVKSQGTIQSRYKQPGNGDWRVRLSLAPYSDYLYNATGAGILAPLTATNGVIFPYTPNITTTYSADYEKYNLIHSNYRGLFYKSSSVGDVQIRGTFTAQDTREAAYLLAVIHFFRSVTKMFYGQDAERGTPPPLVYLSGYGDQQFSNHACVVGSFNYSLPNEVDYIRTNAPNNFGPNMGNRQTPRSTSPGGINFAGAIRLANALLNKGAIPELPAQNALRSAVNNTNECTYVPTKMEIDITLIPVQTRSQVSKQFSLKEFANGNLLKKGFW